MEQTYRSFITLLYFKLNFFQIKYFQEPPKTSGRGILRITEKVIVIFTFNTMNSWNF